MQTEISVSIQSYVLWTWVWISCGKNWYQLEQTCAIPSTQNKMSKCIHLTRLCRDTPRRTLYNQSLGYCTDKSFLKNFTSAKFFMNKVTADNKKHSFGHHLTWNEQNCLSKFTLTYWNLNNVSYSYHHLNTHHNMLWSKNNCHLWHRQLSRRLSDSVQY